jgi:large subunit ribosomal protein L4
MIEAPHFSATGAKRKSDFGLPAEFFDGTVNQPALHQAVTAFLNNQRQGTHKTKTRSFVSGGNQKPWKQKGTGRARQGSIRAPHWRGGGIVFGPLPRDYRKSALNARAGTGALYVVEQFQFGGPKTSQLAELLDTLGLTGKKTLVLTHGVNHAVYLSGRNIPRVEVMNYADASAYDVIWSDAVVVEEGAFSGEPPVPYVAPETTEAPAKKTTAPKPKRTAKSRGEKPAARAEKASAKAATKASKAKREKPKAKKAPAKHAPSKGAGKAAPKKKKGGK